MILSKRFYDNVSPISEPYSVRIVCPLCKIFRFNVVCLGTFLSRLLKYLISQIATGYSVQLCIDDFCYIIALRRSLVSHFNEARRFENRLWRNIWCRLMTYYGCNAAFSQAATVSRTKVSCWKSRGTVRTLRDEYPCRQKRRDECRLESPVRDELSYQWVASTPLAFTGQTGHLARSTISIFRINDKIMRESFRI